MNSDGGFLIPDLKPMYNKRAANGVFGAEENTMKRTWLLAACWIITSLGPGVRASATDFDIAPFARRCCMTDRHTSPLEFDYREAEQAGGEAEE